MRYVLAVGAVAAVTIAACSESGVPVATTVEFDGTTYTIEGFTSCLRRLDGTLTINAPVGSMWSGGGQSGKKLIRVVLEDEGRLVVRSAGIRIDGVRGFSETSEEMWATRVDNTYTINGRMAPEGGASAAHQFKIEVTCASIETEYVTLNPPVA